jgi:hypothetical protein
MKMKRKSKQTSPIRLRFTSNMSTNKTGRPQGAAKDDGFQLILGIKRDDEPSEPARL